MVRILVDSGSVEANEEMTSTDANVDVRRSHRARQPSQTLRDYEVYIDDQITDEGDLVHLALYADTEPMSLNEAMKDPKWIFAMKEEMNSIEKNHTYDLMDTLKKKSLLNNLLDFKLLVKNERLVDPVPLYVDDLLITRSNKFEIDKIKQLLMKQFEMTGVGPLSYFLGIEFKETKIGILMHQSKYATNLLKRFNMVECNATTTPIEMAMSLKDEGELVDTTLYKQIVGSLRYLCNTIPDLAFNVGLINRFMQAPKTSHMMTAKRIMRYIKGTINYGVLLSNDSTKTNAKLFGYTDSDRRRDNDDRKSTFGYIFLCGEAPINWCSKKEDPVALSTYEAEYIADSMCSCQGLWFGKLLKEMKIQ
ncbi:uncharacterized protein LOC113865251 [Abrus precatorius]|uniref:Uncharacterized protein LOC113865251 n=1 Tax=Abrus precatorius TaxID=3816 RepID=A0A8B8LGJ2_ABRPR|nr:uncharacterized protein LOC113865251 [Abrus precatorius]